MFNKRKCAVCGHKLTPTKATVYTIEERKGLFQTIPAKTFDAIDCPRCGCQNALAVRLPKLADNKLLSLMRAAADGLEADAPDTDAQEATT